MAARAVNVDMVFGQRLKLAMTARGATNAHIAKALDVGVGQVVRWRRGELPEPLRIPLLEDVLDLPAGWLEPGQVQDTASGPLTVPRKPPSSPPEPRSGATPREKALLSRLRFLADQIKAYQMYHRPPSPEVLAEWLEVVGDFEELKNGET